MNPSRGTKELMQSTVVTCWSLWGKRETQHRLERWLLSEGGREGGIFNFFLLTCLLLLCMSSPLTPHCTPLTPHCTPLAHPSLHTPHCTAHPSPGTPLTAQHTPHPSLHTPSSSSTAHPSLHSTPLTWDTPHCTTHPSPLTAHP